MQEVDHVEFNRHAAGSLDALRGVRSRFNGVIAAFSSNLCSKLVENPWDGH